MMNFYEAESRRAERYAAAGFWERRYHVRRQELICGILNDVLRTCQSFLDAGCGTGEYLAFASQRLPTVVGLDLSAGYLRRTRSRGINDLARGDIRALPFRDQVFDCTLTSEVLEHLLAQEPAISELFRVSRRWILVSMPNEGLLRRIGKRISRTWIDSVDATVGHVGILSVEKLLRKLAMPGWVPRKTTVLHVFPPTLDEMKIPRVFACVVAQLERVLDKLIPALGTTSIVLLERAVPVHAQGSESPQSSELEVS